jgi:diguanylate cyclase (GGDEF)-like protein
VYYSRKVADDADTRSTRLTPGSAVAPPVEHDPPQSACLVVIYGSELGKRITLDRTVTDCGRSLQMGIPLDDESVSRKHARFAWTGSGYVVTDLGSTNGTYVNDVSVRERALVDGDQIKIGRTIFKLIFGSNVELSYHEEIYRLMTFDGLTQIQNQRAFESAFEREVVRSHRSGRPLCLALFDLDHFKRVNDDFGHLAGDAVLRQLAALVRSVVRQDYLLARVGGEEFALILPDVPLPAARELAESLRSLIERTPCHFEESSIAVTVSFGVAELPRRSAMSPVDLYTAADQRLYDAKKAGRNRVA